MGVLASRSFTRVQFRVLVLLMLRPEERRAGWPWPSPENREPVYPAKRGNLAVGPTTRVLWGVFPIARQPIAGGRP